MTAEANHKSTGTVGFRGCAVTIAIKFALDKKDNDNHAVDIAYLGEQYAKRKSAH